MKSAATTFVGGFVPPTNERLSTFTPKEVQNLAGMSKMTQDWTEVTEVDCLNASIDVWLGRRKHSIVPGDKLTFVGETNESLFKNGHTYTFGGYSWRFEEDYAFRDCDTWIGVAVYKEDVRSYLLDGDFKLHDV